MKLSRWRRNYRATRTSQYSASISGQATTSDVHAVLRLALADLRGSTLLQHPRVLVATGISDQPISQLTDPPCSQVPGPSSCMHIATGIS